MRHRPAGSPRDRARPGWGASVLRSKGFGPHGESYEYEATFILTSGACQDLPNDLLPSDLEVDA